MLGGEPGDDRAATTPLEGELAVLHPVFPNDHDYIYFGLLQGSPGDVLRSTVYREIGSREAFAQAIGDRAFAQFVASANASQSPIGLLSAVSPNLQDGHAYVDVVARRDDIASPSLQEAWDLFLRYLFDVWPFRKLYWHVGGYQVDVLEPLVTPCFAEEGTLTGHEYLAGRLWDTHLFATYRSYGATSPGGNPIPPE